jgi:hypothetical protein
VNAKPAQGNGGKVIEVNGKHDGKAVGRKTAAAAVTLPAPETHSGSNVGTGNDIVAQEQNLVAPQDSISQHMQSIGRAETWRSEENHAGMFGPYQEEYE